MVRTVFGGCGMRLAAMLAVVASSVISGPERPALADTPAYYLAVWGGSGAGPLGTTACCDARAVPTGVPGAGMVSAAVASGDGVVVVRPDGTVWTWGPYLPRPSIPSLLPKQVPGLSHIVELAAGGQFVLALTSAGAVWSWGSGAIGRPTSTLTQATTPTPVPGLSGVTRIAAGGNNGLAVTSDGSLYSWGENWAGQIGDGTRTERRSPVRVSALSHVISAATSGQNAVAAESDGSVWAWGDDATGVPKRPGIFQSLTPLHVNGVPAADQVIAGFSTGLARARDGKVWGWGENSGDSLHIGQPSQGVNGSPPSAVVGLKDVTSIASGANRYMAIERDGSVWTWAGGSGAPARQPGVSGAVAIAANPDEWLALASSPPPAPARRSLVSCSRLVKGDVVIGSLPSSLLIDQQTGHVFVIDLPPYRAGNGTGPLCTASLDTLDGRTGRVIRTVRMGKGTISFSRSPMGAYLSGPTLALDGSRVYVAYGPSLASQDTAGGVSVVDTRTGALIRSVSVGYLITGLAAGDGTHRAYVSFTENSGTNNEGSTVPSLATVDGSRGTVRARRTPLTGTTVLDPRAGRLFILGDTSSTAIDTHIGTVIRSVSYSGGSLAGYGLAEHSGRLYAAYGVSPHCCGPSLQLLDSHTGKRTAQLGTAGQYGPLVVDARAGRVLVARSGFASPVRGLTEVREAASGRLLRTLPYLIGPSAADSRNGWIYTITGPDTVTVLNPVGWRVTGRFHPGGILTAIAIDQRTNRVFLLSRSGQGIAGIQTVHSICIVRRCTR